MKFIGCLINKNESGTVLSKLMFDYTNRNAAEKRRSCFIVLMFLLCQRLNDIILGNNMEIAGFIFA